MYICVHCHISNYCYMLIMVSSLPLSHPPAPFATFKSDYFIVSCQMNTLPVLLPSCMWSQLISSFSMQKVFSFLEPLLLIFPFIASVLLGYIISRMESIITEPSNKRDIEICPISLATWRSW